MARRQFVGCAMVFAVCASVTGAAAAAPAKPCHGDTPGGSAACFASATGERYTVDVPVTAELPLPGSGDCADLPAGIGMSGTVRNTSPDTLYVVQGSCGAADPDVIATVPPTAQRTLPARRDRHQIHAALLCGPGLVLDRRKPTCNYPALVPAR